MSINYNDILISVGVTGGLGLIFGIVLTVAAKIFYIKTDPRVDEVRSVLPGANCGACGQAGCDAFAKAVVEGRADANGCIPGGDSTAEKVGAILGISVGDSGPKEKAVVRCQGNSELCGIRFNYSGISTCLAASQVHRGPKNCEFSCLGFGDCVKACPFDAINIIDGIAHINRAKCRGCKKCVSACPKQLIAMQDQEKHYVVCCRNTLQGAISKQSCGISCIGCRICVKNCPSKAISMNEYVAEINPELCTNCNICYEKCPTKAICRMMPNKTNTTDSSKS